MTSINIKYYGMKTVKFEVTFGFPEYSGRTIYKARVESKLRELLKYDKDTVSVVEIKK